MGHVFGLVHDDALCMSGSSNDGDLYRTIMDGSKECSDKGHVHTNYFSNPDVIHPETSTVTGDDTHNSAKMIKEKRFLMESIGNETGTCYNPNSKNYKRCFKTDQDEFWWNEQDQVFYNQIKQNELVSTIPFWGYQYSVKFDIQVFSFENANILHFTTGRNS